MRLVTVYEVSLSFLNFLFCFFPDYHLVGCPILALILYYILCFDVLLFSVTGFAPEFERHILSLLVMWDEWDGMMLSQGLGAWVGYGRYDLGILGGIGYVRCDDGI